MENCNGMFLYRYRAWNANTKSMLLDRKFYYATLNQLNDSNEGKNFDSKTLATEYMRSFLKDETYNLSNMEEVIANQAFSKIRDCVRVVCLSEDSNNSELWDKYGDLNRGICIEYFFSENMEEEHLKPKQVYYENINITDENSHLTHQIKEKIWENEHEWRLVFINPDLSKNLDKLLFCEYPINRMLCSITIGHAVTDDVLEDIQMTVAEVNQKFNMDISIHYRVDAVQGVVLEDEEKWKQRLCHLGFIPDHLK